jgi:hypothetical protein
MSKKNKKTSERLVPVEKPQDQATQASPPPGPRLEEPPPPARKGRALGYTDPGTERGLPAPVSIWLQGGERVRLKKTQEYADGVVVREGEIGTTVNPSSQAASWVVSFPKVAGSKLRVVPQWDLERVDRAPAAH